jgi:CelD/BcsL family acetyltransferase involved in cellulose biosynthesis
MEVREFDHPDQLRPYASAWKGLLEQTPGATFFQSLHWLEVYWKHYGAAQRLVVLMTFERGEPAGILPLVVRRERTRLGSLKFLTYPLDYWGSFYGPIGPRPQETLEHGLEYLRSRRRDWDLLELRWVGGRPEELEESEAVLGRQHFAHERTTLDTTGIISLSGSWEDFLAARSSKWRNNLRRWERRLTEQGEVTFLRHRTDENETDPRWDLYEACLAIAQASWQGASTDGTTLSHASVQPFLKDVHEAAARDGGVDLNLLLFNGRPFAFAYNYHFRGNVFGLRVGYDASVSRDGVGNVLYARAIEDSFRRGDWRYDMGPGSLERKRYFVDEAAPIYRLSCFQPYSVRQQLLRWKRRWDKQPDKQAGADQALGASPRLAAKTQR